MIHDVVAPVTCDGEHCRDEVLVELDYVYRNMSENSGQYDDDDANVEEKLKSEHEWFVRDGKHYCSAYCAGEEEG